MTRLLLIALLLAAGPARLAPAGPPAVDLNPPYGDSVFQPFGIFPVEDLAGGLRPEVIVVFHGFRTAIPNRYYKRLRRALGARRSVIGINYEYFDVEDTMRRLDAFAAEHLRGRRVTVFGSSLGGHWAAYFANRIGAEKLILINPSTRPQDTLGRHAGQSVFVYRRQVEFMVTPEMVQRYAGMKIGHSPATRILVVLARDDAVVDYRIAKALYAGDPRARIRLYDAGGHTLNLREHPAMKEIAAFVRAPAR